jgi:hypothetical protein
MFNYDIQVMKKYYFALYAVISLMLCLGMMNCFSETGYKKSMDIQKNIAGKWQLVGREYEASVAPEPIALPANFIEFISGDTYLRYQSDTVVSLSYRIDSEFLYAVENAPHNTPGHSRIHIYKYSLDRDQLKLYHLLGIFPKTVRPSETLIYRRVR